MTGRRETARDVLYRLRWGSGREDLEGVTIMIRHGGAPGDRKAVDGRQVIRLGRGSFDTDRTSIPYHRVLEITRSGELLYRRG